MLHCPRCGSADIFTVAGGCTGSLWRCKSCGYQGAFVIECEEEGYNPAASREEQNTDSGE